MSLTNKTLDDHCKRILLSRRIQNKAVVLCEGDLPPLNLRHSPSAYSRMEVFPDANFYAALIQRKQNRPQFFNCGSRNSVIKTFFRLRELHLDDSQSSYLDPDRLYAIIDCDLHNKNIDDYLFADTEEIRDKLYSGIHINESNIPQHKIFTTGLVHKEAYFLLPELQGLFDDSPYTIKYSGSKLNLQTLYTKVINDVPSDSDIAGNLPIVQNRLFFNPTIDTSSPTKIQSSLTAAMTTATPTQKTELIYSLLSICKSKPYWKTIQFAAIPVDNLRLKDDFVLSIAKFISKQSDTRFHLPQIFASIN